jgi:pimeloyl-ACP methyl ester carboxylesterase
VKIALLLLVVLLIPVGLVGSLYLTQDGLIYPRIVNDVPPPSAAAARFEAVRLPTPDGAELAGVAFPPEGPERPDVATAPRTVLVLAFGGNAHDVVGFATFLKNTVFPQPGVAVAGVSYRGYANALGTASTGAPSERALKADALLIHDAMVARFRPDAVVAIGYSLGSAVATYLASQRPLAGLVLVAPPASIRRLAQEQYPLVPVSLLLKSPWATEDILPGLTLPVTALYAPADELVPAAHIEVLRQANPRMTAVAFEDTSHGTILDHPRLPQVLRDSLAAALAAPVPAR